VAMTEEMESSELSKLKYVAKHSLNKVCFV